MRLLNSMRKEIGIIIGLGVIIGVLLFILLSVKKTNSGNTTQPVTKGTSVKGSTVTNASSAPSMQINAEKQYQAQLNTSEGTIIIELTASKTPITVNNFVCLARKGFYDNTVFHRVIKGFMI